MATGVVQTVDVSRAGDVLAAAAGATDTVLTVADAGDFEEDFEQPRWLVIGDETTPREYVAVVNDDDAANTVTLAAATGVALEAGLPVTLWDPDAAADDKRAVEYQAWVLLDGQDTPVPVRVPHDTIPLAGAFSLIGASVAIGETGEDTGEWEVTRILGRDALMQLGDAFYVDPTTGVATFIGEVGTAPPGESGVFMFSQKFSRKGVQVTRPIVQLNSGTTRDQPSIQADSQAGAGLSLHSGADENQRETSVYLLNGSFDVQIEDEPDSGVGARALVENNQIFVTSKATFGAELFSTLVWGTGSFFQAGFRSQDGTLNEGMVVYREGAVRILSTDPVEVISASGGAYRKIRALEFEVMSDAASKTDIGDPRQDALPIVRGAPVFEFEQGDGPRRLGVLADDLPDHLTSRVADDADLYPGMRTVGLTQQLNVLWQAVRELDAVVAEQSDRIIGLEEGRS